MTVLSNSAVIQRINRKLAHEDQRLCTLRTPSRWQSSLGDYYIVDHRNNIVASHVDPTALALELGVLQLWETVTDDEVEG
jgi:hypothetical protein